MPTKLIEVALPLDVINKEAAREKSIRHGHPSTVHPWWARRPLAACRAVLFAQLVDDPSAHSDLFPTERDQNVERQRLFRIIERLVPWEASGNEAVLREAHAEIQKSFPSGLPKILDPFCGGGSIPLEAQRLGLEAEGRDLNPVAVLVTKALVELPALVAGRAPTHPEDGTQRFPVGGTWDRATGLAEDLRWYGNWIRDKAIPRLQHLYPPATLPDGTTAPVLAWLWARTVECPNPACRTVTPLVRSCWLDKRKGKGAWLQLVPHPSERRVEFRISHGIQGPPLDGTVTRSGAVCVACNNPVGMNHIKAEGLAGRMTAQMIAIVVEGPGGRAYQPPDPMHERVAQAVRPQETPDTELSTHPQYMGTPRYGLTTHGDLFTSRQLIALCALSDLVGEAHTQLIADSGGDRAYADAVATYLAECASKAAVFNTHLARWRPNEGKSAPAFGRQAIAMTWDFAEVHPFGGAGGDWAGIVEGTARAVAGLPARPPGYVTQANATASNFSGRIISTDPPYYDNVPYADLSDYFYVWLRRMLRGTYPELFGTILTPKDVELVADSQRYGGRVEAERHFEDGFADFSRAMLAAADKETPSTVYYAFRQTDTDAESRNGAAASTGWEKMLEGLLKTGLTITATWPMRTESQGRLRNIGSNALASSIVLVCRARSVDAGVTDRRGFQQALKSRLSRDLRILQSGGIAPVDLAQAAIGPGMAVFSSYAKIVEPYGSAMSVRTALGLINQMLDEVTAEQEGEFDGGTRWAVAWYAEHGMDDGPFGRADDLSRAKNVSVEGLVRAGIVKSGAGKVRLLDRSELDPDWDPATDMRLTIWEVTQQLTRRLLDESEVSAADLLSRVGGLGEPARDLAYRLFQIAESKRWAKEAGPYNALAAAWPELSRRAAIGRSVQETLL